jgi:hypothetical protein
MSAPTSARCFIPDEVGQWIRDLIYDNLRGSGELSLKECRYGDLMNIAVQDVNDMVPGVFVKPVNVSNQIGDLDGLDYLTTYRFRVVFVTTIPQGARIEPTKTKGCRIADLLVRNVSVRNPTVQSAYQSEPMHCTVPTIDFSPEEDSFVAMINADFHAMALDVDVLIHTYLPPL